MKAILLVRVSTKAQEFDEQEREIYNMAIKDGYKPEDIIPVCEKESGIKLSEEERAGLNRMKELIEADPTINCVYCWEVSRIARRKKINFSVLDYLLSHKVQLIVKNPSIKLIKENGEIDEGAEVVFTLFSQIAESEMRTKLARWKRTKDAKRKQGYFCGGAITYGYMKGEDGKLVIKEEEANVVRDIFRMYLSGECSTRTIAKELLERGIYKGTLLNASRWVSNIINNGDYCGMSKDGNVYPPLVTPEDAERCKEIASINIQKPKKLYTTYYFGKGILRCPKCGGVMAIRKNRSTYSCPKCEKINIQINMVDSVLWNASFGIYVSKMLNATVVDRIEIQKQMMDLDTKISVANASIKEISDRIEKIEYKAYVEGKLDIDKADKFIKELNSQISVEKKNIISWANIRHSKQQMLIEMDSNKGYNLDTLVNIKDDKERFDIIHSVFDCAFIDRLEYGKYTLSVYPIGWSKPLKYTLYSRQYKIFTDETETLHDMLIGRYSREIDGVPVIPEPEEIPYEHRFTPMRSAKETKKKV